MLSMSDSFDLRPQSLGSLHGKNDAESIRKVAKEMESLFAYEMIKVMRETTESSADSGLGNSTYLSMFDIELSKLFAERGLGLQEMLARGLTSLSGKAGQAETPGKTGDRDPTTPATREIQSLLPDIPHAHISSGYGFRKDPFTGDRKFHQGIDIAAPAGAEVHAVGKGTVTFSGEQSGYGNVVIIDHGNGYSTKYAHNQLNLVKEGDEVDYGSVVAQVGSTGRSTGSHIHFEVLFNGQAVNPGTVLAKG
jgi:murein DD-endopeptidase MepM/ murein hydrolase activator NlpD